MKKLLLSLVVLAALGFDSIVGAAPPVSAPASIALVETAPSVGDTIHFTATLGELDTHCAQGFYGCGWILVICYQAGVAVYGASQDAEGHLANGPYSQFILGSNSNWTSGDAECVAQLGQIKREPYGHQSFEVHAFTTFHAGD